MPGARDGGAGGGSGRKAARGRRIALVVTLVIIKCATRKVSTLDIHQLIIILLVISRFCLLFSLFFILNIFTDG